MGLISRTTALAVGMLSLAVGVAGCAPLEISTTLPPSSSVTPAPTKSTVPVDPVAAFRSIADASCEQASTQGVVEMTADGAAGLIMIPKDDAYKDFNAVSFATEGGSDIVWTTEDFASCNASVGFAMAEESGGTYDLAVTVDTTTGMYRTEFSGDSAIVTTYVITDGLISQAVLGSDDSAVTMNVTYGMPSDANVAILHDTVDAFLAAN